MSWLDTVLWRAENAPAEVNNYVSLVHELFIVNMFTMFTILRQCAAMVDEIQH